MALLNHRPRPCPCPRPRPSAAAQLSGIMDASCRNAAATLLLRVHIACRPRGILPVAPFSLRPAARLPLASSLDLSKRDSFLGSGTQTPPTSKSVDRLGAWASAPPSLRLSFWKAAQTSLPRSCCLTGSIRMSPAPASINLNKAETTCLRYVVGRACCARRDFRHVAFILCDQIAASLRSRDTVAMQASTRLRSLHSSARAGVPAGIPFHPQTVVLAKNRPVAASYRE
jgi:hypothetical protein